MSEEAILTDLARLGETPEEVARALLAAGHKGWRYCPTDCPVSRYLAACGYQHDGIREYCHLEYNGRQVDLPRAVELFAMRFDQRQFPELEW